jgi:fatty acid desaturase
VVADAAGLREVLARFQEALPHVAAWQIVTTILPLIALLVAMHAGLAFGCWPVLALGVPAAALTVRTFIIQHDCGHRSFCRACRTNDYLGRFCSLLTLTPYGQWRRPSRETSRRLERPRPAPRTRHIFVLPHGHREKDAATPGGDLLIDM